VGALEVCHKVCAAQKVELKVNADLTHPNNRPAEIAGFVGWLGFWFLLAVVALVIYHDDIQLTGPHQPEVPTIYNTRIIGIKILDALSVCLIVLSVIYGVLRHEITVVPFHYYVGTVLLVYCWAGFVGYVYSFFLRYDYVIWLQDFQQTVYLVGFSLFTYWFIDSKTKWKVFALSFIGLLAAKNVFILYNTFSGKGKTIGDWAFRASQNAEFAYFPMMFFPLVLLLFNVRSIFLRLLIVTLLLIYLLNSLLGIYRTVWVMLIVGIAYLLLQVDSKTRIRMILWGGIAFAVSIGVAGALYPRFLDLAWNFKFASIFSWSLQGDRSNATRILEVINIVDYVFRHFAFLQGMGLGAWWDDEARRLLPDLGSGFTYKTRYHTGHMWYVTQLLKVGLIGMAFYWYAVYKLFSSVRSFARTLSWTQWERSVLVGLNVGLLCAFVSSADFVRLFLIIGVNLGITGSFIYLNRTRPVSGS
jgi:hypothetical protein